MLKDELSSRVSIEFTLLSTKLAKKGDQNALLNSWETFPSWLTDPSPQMSAYSRLSGDS